MRYSIEGERGATLAVTLEQGERLYVEPEMLLDRGEDAVMQRQIKGKLLRGLKRKLLTGESFFLEEYRAVAPEAVLRLGRRAAEEAIVPVYLKEQAILCRRNAFLGFHGEMDLDVVFAATRASAGQAGRLFSAKAFVLQKISGSGIAFLYADAYLVETPGRMKELLRRGLSRLPLFGVPANGATRVARSPVARSREPSGGKVIPGPWKPAPGC